jgi:hypothetical protein
VDNSMLKKANDEKVKEEHREHARLDHFAGLAMNMLLASNAPDSRAHTVDGDEQYRAVVARASYKMADAMLAERRRREEEMHAAR